MNSENILMLYKGDFSQETILPILQIFEKNLQISASAQIKTKRLLFHFLTEMLQNISKHSEILNNKRDGIFLIGKENNSFFICTGNFILNKNIGDLKNNIDNLNNADKLDLNKLYIKKLREGNISNDGSAGLGLLDIIRECNDKLQYHFDKIDENISFLSFYVKL